MPSLADILMMQGDAASRGLRQRGAIRGQQLADLGAVPGQIMQDRQQAQMQRQKAAMDQAELQRRATHDAAMLGQGQQRIDLDTAQFATEHDAAANQQAQAQAQEQRGRQAVLGWLKQHGQTLPAGAAERMVAVMDMPGGLKVVMDGLAKAPEPLKLTERDPSKDLVNPMTGAVVAAGTPQPKMREVVVKGPNGRPVRKLVPEADLIAGVEEYRAPESGAMPAFQAKEVLGDDGKPVMASFDPRSNRWLTPAGQSIANPRPVPSAAETQDARKFKQAAPILSGVSQLSERINTQAGLIAKMSGGVEKLKAQANYNDDVAEYEALISGFTPLVARALGHTGVLTQQDVDSVKALFPQPGNSKSLRDRKIARITSIIGDLEAGAGGTPSVTPPPDDADFDFVPGKGLVRRTK